MQCGADSLKGDLIGSFNISTRGHGQAVNYMKSKSIPMVVVGGGGYTKENVSRCWAYETSVCLGNDLPNKLPEDLEYAADYREDPTLHFTKYMKKSNDLNDKEYLDNILQNILSNLKKIEHAPNIQSMEVPTDYSLRDEQVWNETEGDEEGAKIIDRVIFKDKGVNHLREYDSK